MSSLPVAAARRRPARRHRNRSPASRPGVRSAGGVRGSGIRGSGVSGRRIDEADQDRRRHRRRHLDDKNFNEYTYEGAKDGAAASGARTSRRSSSRRTPRSTPTNHPELRRPGLQHHRHGRLHPGTDTTRGRQGQPGHLVRRRRPGRLRRPRRASPTRRSRARATRRRCCRTTSRIIFQEDQPGYLAGIVAASSASPARSAPSAASPLCGPCIRYIQGYELGAKSVNPDIEVTTYLRTTSDFAKALQRPGHGQDLRRAVHRPEQARRPLPGRRPDRQRRPRGRLRGGHPTASASTSTSRCPIRTPPSASSPAPRRSSRSPSPRTSSRSPPDTAKGGDDHWRCRQRRRSAYSPFHDKESADPGRSWRPSWTPRSRA